jgi:hypothetical protein
MASDLVRAAILRGVVTCVGTEVALRTILVNDDSGTVNHGTS